MLPEVTKEIKYSRETRDYDVFITIGNQREYIGSASTYGQAEILANDYAIGYFENNNTPEKAAELVMANCLSGHVAARTYPAFARYTVAVEALELPDIVIDLGAQLADELATHIS